MLVLASASPHRAKLLSQLGYDFQIYKTNIEEVLQENPSPPQTIKNKMEQKPVLWGIEWNLPLEAVKNIAKEKASAAAKVFPHAVILAADTVVVNTKGKVLLKPRSPQEARAFLQDRNGSSEAVVTGFCLRNTQRYHSDVGISYVRFHEIPPLFQEKIIRSNEWRNVCGGLKIEGMNCTLYLRISREVARIS